MLASSFYAIALFSLTYCFQTFIMEDLGSSGKLVVTNTRLNIIIQRIKRAYVINAGGTVSLTICIYSILFNTVQD